MERPDVIVNRYANPAGFDIQAEDVAGRLLAERWPEHRSAAVETNEAGIYTVSGRFTTWVTKFTGDGLTVEDARTLAREARDRFDAIAREEGPLVHLVWNAEQEPVNDLEVFSGLGYAFAPVGTQPFLPRMDADRFYRVSGASLYGFE